MKKLNTFIKTYLSFLFAFLLIAIPIALLIRSFNLRNETARFMEQQHRSTRQWERLSNHFKSAEILTPAFEDFRDKRFFTEYQNDLEAIPSDIEALQRSNTDSIQLARLDTILLIYTRHKDWLVYEDQDISPQESEQNLKDILLVHQIIDNAIERSSYLLNVRMQNDNEAELRTKRQAAILIIIGLSIFIYNSVSLIRELNRRKILNRELALRNEELNVRNKETETFAFISSHHFQEPVRIITSLVQLIQRRYQDKLDKDANEFIGFTVVAADRMKALLKDIQRYLSINWNPPRQSGVDINKLVKDILETRLKNEIQTLHASVEIGVLPVVTANEQQMYILFEELLKNSLKFRSEKPPEIVLTAEQSESGYHFTLKDNGTGLDTAYQSKAFTIFQRLHDETYEGTGIGLSICKKIIDAHGGKIWYESVPGQGTAFHFTVST